MVKLALDCGEIKGHRRLTGPAVHTAWYKPPLASSTVAGNRRKSLVNRGCVPVKLCATLNTFARYLDDFDQNSVTGYVKQSLDLVPLDLVSEKFRWEAVAVDDHCCQN